MHEQRDTRLDKLLDHIQNGRNDEAKAMLNKELAQAFDPLDFQRTPLHHAISNNNLVIARKLIELGADVNRFGGESTTPLTVAVLSNNVSAVQLLLAEGARVEVVDDKGISALRMAIEQAFVNSVVFNVLVFKLSNEATTSEELAEILMKAGCNMSHAATLMDIDVMECMLKRGIDVNSMNIARRTALHVAVKIGDDNIKLNMANWLLSKGINVDATDASGSSALTISAENADKAMLRFLLEHGASPNVKEDNFDGFTPLYTVFRQKTYWELRTDEFVECAELLLQHGASLGNADADILDMFDFALARSCDKAVKLLIAHLAMLEMLGQPVDKAVMRPMNVSYLTKMSELQKYYAPCQQVLKIEMFEKMSLLDLLKKSDRKMRLLARKETFFQEVDRISSEHNLKEVHSYYYNSMMKRVEKASRVVKLEDEAILVICKLFEANYNQFYDFARGVVEYLNERDLKKLIQV